MATKEESTLPVLLAFKKEINQRKDARRPPKTVQGNVILYVSERTVDFFNIPVYTGENQHIGHRRSTERIIIDKKVPVKECSIRKKTMFRSSRKVKIIYKINYYLLNFPWFFDLAMIRDALCLMLRKNKEKRRFMVLPSQKKRDIYIGNDHDVRVWIPDNGQLVPSLNIDNSKISSLTIVEKSTIQKRSKVKGV